MKLQERMECNHSGMHAWIVYGKRCCQQFNAWWQQAWRPQVQSLVWLIFYGWLLESDIQLSTSSRNLKRTVPEFLHCLHPHPIFIEGSFSRARTWKLGQYLRNLTGLVLSFLPDLLHSRQRNQGKTFAGRGSVLCQHLAWSNLRGARLTCSVWQSKLTHAFVTGIIHW